MIDIINRIWDLCVNWVFTNGVRLVFIVCLLIIGLRAVHMITGRLREVLKSYGPDDESSKRADTLTAIIHSTLRIVIIALCSVMALSELGVQIGPILATAGIMGLAIGFGAQKLVEDVIGGFFILLEDQIRVGDVIQVAGVSGQVERVNLRMVVLRDLAGNVHYIRNGQIGVVSNMTKEYSYYVMDIGVAYREDIDEVIDVIRGIDAELRKNHEYKANTLEPIEILGVDKFADSAVIIKARIKTRPIHQWAVGREFNRQLKKTFDEKGIEIPFPHMTVYVGQDKRGHSPALNVRVGNS